jgi:hypothetical protein
MSLIQKIGTYACMGALALGVGCSTRHVEVPDYQPEVRLYDQECFENGAKIATETIYRSDSFGNSLVRKIECTSLEERSGIDETADFPKTPNNVLYANTLGRFLEAIPGMIAKIERTTEKLNSKTPSQDGVEGTISCNNYETLGFLLDEMNTEIHGLADAVKVTYERADPHPVFPREEQYDFMIDELNEALGNLREARVPYVEVCE